MIFAYFQPICKPAQSGAPQWAQPFLAAFAANDHIRCDPAGFLAPRQLAEFERDKFCCPQARPIEQLHKTFQPQIVAAAIQQTSHLFARQDIGHVPAGLWAVNLRGGIILAVSFLKQEAKEASDRGQLSGLRRWSHASLGQISQPA